MRHALVPVHLIHQARNAADPAARPALQASATDAEPDPEPESRPRRALRARRLVTLLRRARA
jgi:hypothetical protein